VLQMRLEGVSAAMLANVHAMWMNMFMTCGRLARAGLVSPRFLLRCPCCGAGGVRESLEHLLLACPRWAAERAAHLLPVLRAAKAAAWATRPERQRDALYLLLGGECGPHRATSLRLLARSGPEAGRVGAVAAERAEERRRGGAAGARALPAPVPVHAPAPVPVPAPHPAAGREARQGFWLVGLARFLQQVLPVRQDLLPPRSQGRVRAMAGLGAQVGVQRAGARAGRRA
jgi:hypothetical protein